MLKLMGIGLVTIGSLATGGYFLFIRPRYQRWGATKVELERVMPGDHEVKEPTLAFTRAVTIRARPEEIWPWLVQIGYKRAGFYSYTTFEKQMGVPFTNIDRIIPEYQQLKVGDTIPIRAGFDIPVKAIEPNRSLLLVGRDTNIGEVSWVFELYPLSGGHTRLVTRANCSFPNWTLQSIFSRRPPRTAMSPSNLLRDLTMSLFFEPGSFLILRKTLLGIKRRAEQASGQISESPTKIAQEDRILSL
jgi:hypothetical protein